MFNLTNEITCKCNLDMPNLKRIRHIYTTKMCTLQKIMKAEIDMIFNMLFC